MMVQDEIEHQILIDETECGALTDFHQSTRQERLVWGFAEPGDVTHPDGSSSRQELQIRYEAVERDTLRKYATRKAASERAGGRRVRALMAVG